MQVDGEVGKRGGLLLNVIKLYSVLNHYEIGFIEFLILFIILKPTEGDTFFRSSFIFFALINCRKIHNNRHFTL